MRSRRSAATGSWAARAKPPDQEFPPRVSLALLGVEASLDPTHLVGEGGNQSQAEQDNLSPGLHHFSLPAGITVEGATPSDTAPHLLTNGGESPENGMKSAQFGAQLSSLLGGAL